MVLVNQFFGAPADLFKSTNFKVSNIVLLPLFCVFLTLDKLKDGETKNSSFVYGEFFPSVVDSTEGKFLFFSIFGIKSLVLFCPKTEKLNAINKATTKNNTIFFIKCKLILLIRVQI